ncbi:MAG: sporulation protein YabP [Firmicutes bacterium]|nr:sporulation protein YabP [Bacillota bacterium]
MDEKRGHSIALANRQTLSLEGVQHVDNFDDDTIVLSTTMGTLTIRGHNLRIQTLDLDQGRFVAVGEFDALQYGRKKPQRSAGGGTWQKIWR